ncbi:MAG: lysylphosphatidylglycerol synthase domain-containing protein, partial [Clostridiales bacterium]|nr:lysylphosphatidylglycerol synthase domain-containing protein [Clostridiales bacterium]
TVETVVFCIVAFGLLISAHFVISLEGTTRTVTFVVAWVSLAFNFAVPIIIVLASIAPRLGKRLVVKLVHFLHKIHIVKRKYTVTKKYVYEMSEYSNSMKLLVKKWWKLLPLIVIMAIDTLAYICVPFFAVLAVTGVTPTADLMLQMFCMSMISFYVSSLVPTPGTSGANESATTVILLQIATAFGFVPLCGWVVLFWRFATYYVYILAGIILNVTDLIRGAVKNKRASKAE